MVFDLSKYLPKERTELDAEKRMKYAQHYAERLEHYGYFRDESNAKAFDHLADYFARWFAATQAQASYPEKGLFIFGSKGTGKTTAMNIFSGLFGIEMIRIEDLTKAFACGKEKEFWQVVDDLKWRHLIVDDICNESEAKQYGNKIPIADFLKQREYLWKYNGLYTFYTSNAKGRNELTEMYGDTITSRLLGSCEFIKLDGHDRRLQ